MPQHKLLATLQAFHQAGALFILFGGLAAVLQGAPIQTYDIDLVYSREPENIGRVLSVLASAHTAREKEELIVLFLRRYLQNLNRVGRQGVTEPLSDSLERRFNWLDARGLH